MVIIYTDGSSRGNPGPGGYGVVLKYGQHRRELSEGFRRTTNNRMELLAIAYPHRSRCLPTQTDRVHNLKTDLRPFAAG